MVVLLEEDQAERKSRRKLKNQTDTMTFSEGSLQLNTKLPFLYGTQSKNVSSFLYNFVIFSSFAVDGIDIGFATIIAAVV